MANAGHAPALSRDRGAFFSVDIAGAWGYKRGNGGPRPRLKTTMPSTPTGPAAEQWGRLSSTAPSPPIPPMPSLPQSVKRAFPEMAAYEKALDEWRKAMTTALQGPTVFG